jgi:hypothetical protein
VRSDESNESCLWAYAITADHGGVEQYALSGVAGARVRAVGVAGLTVLVSDVSQAEFGERALRLNLENAEWLEDVARAHHQVIDAMAHMFPLLPLRLATVYSNDAAMTAALAGRGDELRDALRRIGGRVEWGVKAYAARQREGERHGSTAGTGPGAGADGAGIAYLKRRRAELSAQEDSRRTAAASARAVHTELSGQAEQARLYPPQAPALSGSKVPMLLNATYLLGADGADRFASAVAATANAHPDLRLVLTGPWPPYSFAGDAGLET